MSTDDAQSYYLRLGPSRYRPTRHAEGAWQPGEQHMAPVSGLLVHAIEDFVARHRDPALQLARLTFEILGMIAAQDLDIVVEVVRPGRSIELLEATMVIAGRPVVRARAWRLAGQDSREVAGGAPAALPGPESLAPWSGADLWGGGYIASVEIRPLPGGQPGHAQAWLHTEIDLVAGEPASELARFIGLVDTANGIATRTPPGEWMFPNLDLSIHLYRQPSGRWVGLETEVVFGADGVGLTTSTLHDERGPVGRAEQILTIRRLGVGAS